MRYPFAYSPDGALVFAPKAQPRVDHRSEKCGHVVRRRKSPKGLFHFYHTKSEQCSGGESEIHFQAKHLIKEGIDDARSSGRTYIAKIKCSLPDYDEFELDLAAISDSGVVEKRSLDKFQPDVSLFRNGELIAGIEVIKSNPMSPEKTKAHRQRFIPSLTVTVTQRNLDSMYQSLTTTASLVSLCDRCQDVLERQMPKESLRLALNGGYYKLRNLEPKWLPEQMPEEKETRVASLPALNQWQQNFLAYGRLSPVEQMMVGAVVREKSKQKRKYRRRR